MKGKIVSDGGYANYKPIRNVIWQFDPEVLVFAAIERLQKVFELKPNEWATSGYLPWELLLLIKWTLNECDKCKRNQPTEKDLSKIINKIKDYTDDFGVPEDSKHKLEKFMRKTAFQQFWFQSGQAMNSIRLSRTIELFINRDCGYDLDALMIEKIGLNRNEFFDFAFVAWVKVTQSETSRSADKVLRNHFYSTIPGVDLKKVELFLNSVSLNWEGAQCLAKQSTLASSYDFQRYEQTPFKHFPFIRKDNGFVCISQFLLSNLMEHFFYDFAKLHSNGSFNSFFGKTFEKYVGEGVSRISSVHLKEQQIKTIYKSSKSVDYFLQTDEGNLLVECKAIELSQHARVNPTDEVLENSLRDSILKSFEQAIDVIKASAGMLDSSEIFIFIVTYKELYLGNGEVAWKEFIENGLSKKLPIEDLSLIQPEKVFFVSIDDFDKISILYQNNSAGLLTKLKTIAKEKVDPRKRKYVSGMYFDNPDEEQLQDLRKNFEEYIQNWASKLQKK
jgi:hypothetical protein